MEEFLTTITKALNNIDCGLQNVYDSSDLNNLGNNEMVVDLQDGKSYKIIVESYK